MNRRSFFLGSASTVVAVGTTVAIITKLKTWNYTSDGLHPLTPAQWSIEIGDVLIGPFGLDEAAPIRIPAGTLFYTRLFIPMRNELSKTRRIADKDLGPLKHSDLLKIG